MSLFFLILWIVIFFLDFNALCLFLVGNTTAALLIHLFASVMLVGMIISQQKALLTEIGYSWLLIVFLIFLPFPFIGSVMAFFMVYFSTALSKVKMPAVDYFIWEEDSRGNEVYRPDKNLNKPIIALLSERDPQIRLKAVLSLRDIEHPRTIRILKRVIRDSDDYVRSYAQNHLQNIISDIDKKILQHKKYLEGHPSNPQANLALAEQYYKLVYLGLVEYESFKEILENSLTCLDSLKSDDPSLLSACELMKLKCFLKMEMPQKAEICLEKLRKMGFPRRYLFTYSLGIDYLNREWPGFFKKLKSIPYGVIPSHLQAVVWGWRDLVLNK